MKYFINCLDLKQVKAKFKELVKVHHPDLNGELEIMQVINAEYDLIIEKGLSYYHAYYKSEKSLNENANNDNLNFSVEDYIKVIKFCLDNGLTVELCGSWLWISGDTKPCKDTLKELGCKWSISKKLWYFTDTPKRFIRSKFSMCEIRAKHGSKVFRRDMQLLA